MLKLDANTDISSGGGGVRLACVKEGYDPDVPTGAGTAHGPIEPTADPKAKVDFGPTATNDRIFKSCPY